MMADRERRTTFERTLGSDVLTEASIVHYTHEKRRNALTCTARNNPAHFRICKNMLRRTKGEGLSGILSQTFKPGRFRPGFSLLERKS